MQNLRKNSPITKVASKKTLNANKVVLKSFKFYKKTSGIIDRTNIALGKKAVFTPTQCSTTNIKCSSHGISSTQKI
ncbi:MAG: hypothetical protein U9O66_01890 [Patescibacteria group bacterium]|nr:hypothetical protein [Patescibacteria group bacterium]